MNSINYRIDNLQYCNWSEKIFKINRKAKLDAIHVTVAYKELYKLSEDTFVPETDSLKNSAAGAGLTDND